MHVGSLESMPGATLTSSCAKTCAKGLACAYGLLDFEHALYEHVY